MASRQVAMECLDALRQIGRNGDFAYASTLERVAAALEPRGRLKVPPAGTFMLLAARGAAPRPSRCSQQTQYTQNSTACGSFDVGLEIGHSPGHGLCPN